MGSDSHDPHVLRAAIEARPNWYHRIQFAPGVVSPGVNDSPAVLSVLDRLGLPSNLRGIRALDVGACDGFFSFALEQRGAEVVAIDYVDAEARHFAFAAELLGSNVSYHRLSVYDLTPEHFGSFDLVLFLGVIYHLRNPLLALDRIRGVSRVHGMLFVESQMAVAAISELQQPLWQFCARDSLMGVGTNKWVPNRMGLITLVQESQFKIEDSHWGAERGIVRATAVVDEQLERFRLLDERGR